MMEDRVGNRSNDRWILVLGLEFLEIGSVFFESGF